MIGARAKKTVSHLREAWREAFLGTFRDLRGWVLARTRRKIAVIALTSLATIFFATTRVDIHGHLHGLFLLTRDAGRPLELKDDLKLGDGPRLVGGISLEWLHDLVKPEGTSPRLDLDWDEEEGAGFVTNGIANGVRLQTYFGRYVDSEGKTPQGLFVGGAIPDVAASLAQNQSGMALHDARGWHHVWCSVNEAMLIAGSGKVISPAGWTFVGSRVLISDHERAVIQSEHRVEVDGAELGMTRNAYFKAGRTYFRLGINIVNQGERPVTISYGYGDEPWVGEFGSAEGNVGWSERGVLPVVAWLDPGNDRWGGILDTKTGIANFISWEGSAPDGAYFGNHPGTPAAGELGAPLTSNEVFVGVEWRERTLQPGETLTLRLTIGLASSGPDGRPTFPPGAIKLP